MSELGRCIAENTEKMNMKVAEGYTYHELKDAYEYIHENLVYVSTERTNTRLVYLGYRPLTPEEAVEYMFRQGQARPFNLTTNDVTFVEYSFHYGDEPEPRKSIVAVPFARKGNIMKFSDKNWTVMPTIKDKVISIGTNQVFVDVFTGKYNFNRITHTIIEDGQIRNISVVVAAVYIKKSKRLPPTTNAKPTMLHYLLAYYGYSKTVEYLLGFVPSLVINAKPQPGKKIIQSRGVAPDNYFYRGDNRLDLNQEHEKRSSLQYKPNRICFVIDEEQDSPEVSYVLGNILYVLDHFPTEIDINDFDDPITWRRYMGEIILSANHSISWLISRMALHFDGFEMPFDNGTKVGLLSSDIEASNMFELMLVIFKNFNNWIATGSNGSFYHHKRLDSKSETLGKITSMFTKLYFDINKEETQVENKLLEPEKVSKSFSHYIKPRAILSLRRDKTFVQITEDSTDNLYFKGTAFVNKQEGSSINTSTGSNTSVRHKLHASMGTVGSLLYLSKKNPDPCIRLNPYILLDETDGTILPHPDVKEIVEETQRKLNFTHTATHIKDISDDEEADVEDDDLYDYDDDLVDDFDDHDD